MRVFTLKSEQFVPRPLEEVFEFFARPENLETITPDLLRFHIITPRPVEMHVGSLIDYELHISGIPVHWRTLITAYDPPHGFVDEQIKGPYAFWHHRHAFRVADGGTVIGDEVHYALPFGPLGRLVHWLYVERNVQGIFDHRRAVIARQFGEVEPGAATGYLQAGIRK